jgi:glyoxylase-like metal-dependent hydrolase (beta-lactamase superfamily II)
MFKHALRSFITILVPVLLWGPVQSIAQEQKAGPIKATYSVDQVSPSVYVIHGPLATPNPDNQGFMNNPAFVIGDSGIIVIDSGSTVQVGDMVLSMIKTVSDLPVVATFSTHIHGDHWLGNQAIAEAYPEARHYAHPNMIEQANGGEGQSWVDQMLSLSEGASAGTVYFPPNATTDEGGELTIAGKTFLIFHDPVAHTDTDISILLQDDSVLFLGDTVMNNRMGRMDDGNFKGLIAFLDRMLTLDAQVYVPGHGATGSKQIVENFRSLLITIYSTVEEQYENGLADFEIKPLVLEGIPDPAAWTDLDESLGKLVSLAYLEAEEDAF